MVSCDLELNTFILQNEEKLFQSSYPKPVHDILGKLSLMLVSGDLHKKLRNVALSFTTTSKSRPDFLHYVDKLSISVMKSWKDRRQVVFFKEIKEVRFHIYTPLEPVNSRVYSLLVHVRNLNFANACFLFFI